MKNLAELKRNAHKYTWELTKNSWYRTVAPVQAKPRKVSRVLSNKLAFETIKNGFK